VELRISTDTDSTWERELTEDAAVSLAFADASLADADALLAASVVELIDASAVVLAETDAAADPADTDADADAECPPLLLCMRVREPPCALSTDASFALPLACDDLCDSEEDDLCEEWSMPMRCEDLSDAREDAAEADALELFELESEDLVL
jgi:hypothetical protein